MTITDAGPGRLGSVREDGFFHPSRGLPQLLREGHFSGFHEQLPNNQLAPQVFRNRMNDGPWRRDKNLLTGLKGVRKRPRPLAPILHVSVDRQAFGDRDPVGVKNGVSQHGEAAGRARSGYTHRAPGSMSRWKTVAPAGMLSRLYSTPPGVFAEGHQ